MADLTGQSIDRYHVVEKLGQGGMATVYKAYDTRLERNVAIKVIRPHMEAPEFLKRFEREAKALAQLSHPNIVKVLDYGKFGEQPYLVMEYLPGGTLKTKLGRPMDYRDAIRLVIPIAQALGFAHQQRIIHRDVKPANVLLTESGLPMLSDFGIAKILQVDGAPELTATGVGIGTPEYMAPEQGLGKKVDARADIYALGIVFYELVTGRKPFEADTPLAVVMKQITEPLPRPGHFNTSLPENVEHILFKVLAKNPEDRYQDMQTFVKAMEDCLVAPQTLRAATEGRIAESGGLRALKTSIQSQQILTGSAILQPVQKKHSSIPGWLIAGIIVVGLGFTGMVIALVAGVIIFGGGQATPTFAVIAENMPTQEASALPTPEAKPSPTTELEVLESTGTPSQSLYQEDFSNPGSGWEIGDYDTGSVGYKEGTYFVISLTENMAMWGAAGKNYANVTIEVDAQQVAAPVNNNNDYGVMCRVQDNGDGYSFNISGDGFYSIQKVQGDKYIPLMDWQSSDAIHQGNSANHLKVICDGDSLSFYVNDQLMAETNASDFSTGDIALSATTYEPEVTEIHYDNLSLYYY